MPKVVQEGMQAVVPRPTQMHGLFNDELILVQVRMRNETYCIDNDGRVPEEEELVQTRDNDSPNCSNHPGPKGVHGQ